MQIKNEDKKCIYTKYIYSINTKMTEYGFHPMVILWSSYGDPMVRECKRPVGGW